MYDTIALLRGKLLLLSAGYGICFVSMLCPACVCTWPGCMQVDSTPRIIIEGHEEDLDEAAAHPEFPHIFATACSSGMVRAQHCNHRTYVCQVPVLGFAGAWSVRYVTGLQGAVTYMCMHDNATLWLPVYSNAWTHVLCDV